MGFGFDHIGEVGGNTYLAPITPTIDTAIYAVNDVIGGIQAIANAVRISGGTGIIQSLTIMDRDSENSAFEIYLFSANPATGTYTDQAAMTLHDTDALLCIGRIDVATTDYKSLAASSIGCVRNIGLPIKADTGTSIYAVIRIMTGATYTAATDLKFTFGILRD